MAMEKWKAEKRFPLSHRHNGGCQQLKKESATVAKKSPASSLILCPTVHTARTSSDGAAGTRISLCA
jgi:hypothetical protein